MKTMSYHDYEDLKTALKSARYYERGGSGDEASLTAGCLLDALELLLPYIPHNEGWDYKNQCDIPIVGKD
jgi:hypothetical protein